MANETPNAPRTHFHLILAGVFFPLVSVIAGWILALMHVIRGSETDEEQKWTRLLVALVVLDALVAASGVWIVAHTEDITKAQTAKVEPAGPRIGVTFDPEEGAESKIQVVVAGSPADRAGLKVGDRIDRIDGELILTAKQASDAIAKTAPGAGRTLIVRRGADPVELSVVPEPAPKLAEKGLFEPLQESGGKETISQVLVLLPAALVVIGGILWSTFRTPELKRVWWGLLGVLVATYGMEYGAAVLLSKVRGASSIGGFLIAMAVGQALCVALTLGVRAWAGPVNPPPGPAAMTPFRAGLQGIFYLITGWLRVTVVLWTLDQIAFEGHAVGPQVLEQIAGTHLGGLGIGLFVFAVCVLGPFSEELIFRGFLLPRLASRWGDGRALFASSVLFMLLHPHYGIYMPAILLYGWVFGWVRLRSGGLTAPVLLHMAVNGLSTALIFAKQ